MEKKMNYTSYKGYTDTIDFNLYEDLYGNYIQLDDRFETVHLWSKEIALKNKGRWIPILISKSKYDEQKIHSWNR